MNLAKTELQTLWDERGIVKPNHLWTQRLALGLLAMVGLACGVRKSPPAEERPTASPTTTAVAPALPATALFPSSVPSSPSVAGSAAPARERVLLRMTRDELHLDGQRVASASHPGFSKNARGGHHQAGLPLLTDGLAAARTRSVELVADGDVDYLLLVEALSDVRRIGVKQWSLRVDGTERGQFTFADGDPELTVNDLYFGPSTADRKSTSQLQREGPGTARRVWLVLDIASRVADVAATLQAVSGREVRLSFHTGPF